MAFPPTGCSLPAEFRAITQPIKDSKRITKMNRYKTILKDCCFADDTLDSHFEWLAGKTKRDIYLKLSNSLDSCNVESNKWVYRGREICSKCFGAIFLCSQSTLMRRIQEHKSGLSGYKDKREGKKHLRKLATIHSFETLIMGQGQISPVTGKIEMRSSRDSFREQVNPNS